MTTKQPHQATPENGPDTAKEQHISLPQNDRPEGPFEHSGETSRWTKEEKEEVEQQHDEA